MCKNLDQTIKDILPRASGISLSLHGHLSGESLAGLGVDPVSLALAPNGECARIDMSANDELTHVLKLFLGSLVRLDKIFSGFRQFIGLFGDRNAGLVIFLPAPRESNGN